MITVYDIAKTLPQEYRAKLAEAGLMSANAERDLAIYETFCFLLSQGVPRMQCYEELADMFFTNGENVRKIVSKLKQ